MVLQPTKWSQKGLQQDNFDKFDDESALFWKETGITYGDWTSGSDNDGSRTKSATFPTPESLANNGSLYFHVFIVKSDQSPDRRSRHHVKREVIFDHDNNMHIQSSASELLTLVCHLRLKFI